MSYNNVVAVGCSFTSSDAYNLVDYRETYGGVIAEYFGAKFYNLGKSGGSLHRTNRKILEWCGENKDKFKDTLIIVGMTSLGRLEVWSNRLNRWYNHSDYLQTDVHLPPNLFKFDWSLDERKKWFMNFYNHSAEFTMANNIIIGLQSFLTLNNIDHIFFDALYPPEREWDNLVSMENWYEHPKYCCFEELTESSPEMRYSEDDTHPSKKAHKYWGEKLLEYIDARDS